LNCHEQRKKTRNKMCQTAVCNSENKMYRKNLMY
jgi:hypothetical protein